MRLFPWLVKNARRRHEIHRHGIVLCSSDGMQDAFDCTDGGKADLSGIAGKSAELCISTIAHKAFIEVDESGTEVAATTMMFGVVATSVPPPPIEFRADHPFVFFVEHVPTGMVLFAGELRSL